MTRPLPRFTSSSIAKCAQTSATQKSMPTIVNSSMREVRGVRSSTAARTSLAKAKSDCRIGLDLRHFGFAPCRRRRAAARAPASRGPSATRRPLSNTSSRSTRPRSDGRCVETMMVMSLVGESLQPIEEFGFAAHVEMRGRLVEEQDLRLADQDASEADRLFLAAGKASARPPRSACRSPADDRR